MVIYEDKRKRFEIHSQNGIYENSDNFSMAKQYDITRIIDKIKPIQSFFNNNAFYEYVQSKYFKFTSIENLSKEALRNVINSNSIPVTITVTKLSNGKSKTFKDIRYTDSLVKTIELYNQISWYINKLANYNPDTNLNVQKNESQDFYKQLLLQAFRINQRALISTNKNDKLLKRTELFVKFVQNSIVFGKSHLYGSTITSIERLPSFTDLEYQVIQNFMAYCENIAYNDLKF